MKRLRRPKAKAARPPYEVLRRPEPDTQPMRRSYSAWQSAPVSAGEWTGTMTVNDAPASAAEHMDPRCTAARTWVDLKVAYLESEGMGYRIDDAEQIRQRGDKLDGRSVIARAGREGATHLLGRGADWLTRNSDRPWSPREAGGWAEEWVDTLHWYDPQVREPWWDGLPPTPQQQADPAQPWHHPQRLGGAA